MPININTTNYINTGTASAGGGQNVSANVSVTNSEGAIVSVKGLDLQSGQTISGQVVEVDGKDIKLLLSNNQTINARIEGSINALLGQTLSFEVKNTEDGSTALRPLYTNLNTSPNVSNALASAGLPPTENYVKMVSSMMDDSMSINKQAVYDMSKQINTFPNANPETIVKLNKLGLQVNELTINQFENYKGLEHQIKGNVDTLAKGLSELIRDSLSETVKNAGIDDILPEKNALPLENEAAKTSGKNLFSAFLSALTGNEVNGDTGSQAALKGEIASNTEGALPTDSNEASGKTTISEDVVNGEASAPLAEGKQTIYSSAFDTTRAVLDMVNPGDSNEIPVTNGMKSFVSELAKVLDDENASHVLENIGKDSESVNTSRLGGRENLLNELTKEALKGNETGSIETAKSFSELLSGKEVSADNVLALAKDALNELQKNPQNFSEGVKEKLTKLLSSKEFGTLVKDNLSKQMLLKPEEVVSSKNVEELYSKITKQANQALEIMQSAGKDNPQMLEAAKNIKDNVAFMNELNQVVTYVQLPLLMNNKSAHGDLYVYTNKKSLKNNDGNVSALLHLDMDNLGPMDIYVALTNKTKLNTHFYLKDEATIDFIEAHIDFLNKRLTDKGYDMSLNVSVKDNKKGPTNMAEEFFKDDPLEKGSVSVSKLSFDVRA